ncbi:hypothetical protein LINGRAHAP2_LOCUS31817 [Linum grandiflorum]
MNFNIDETGKVFTCLYCNKKYRGGGITRMKRHLAGVGGEIVQCLIVPNEVREVMLKNLNEYKQSKKVLAALLRSFSDMDQPPSRLNVASSEQGKSIQNVNSSASGDSSIPVVGTPSVKLSNTFIQRDLKSAFAGKDAALRANRAMASWFYEQCFPLSAIDSPLFPSVVENIVRAGYGYKGPSYHALRTNLLQDIKQECKLVIDNLRSHWKQFGCTIMADGWTDKRHRSLINFLAYCPPGTIMVVDASGCIKTVDNLFKLFSSVIDWVGAANVVHVVTDNAANYVVAGKLIYLHYKNIYWNPCVAHTVNLILNDICDMPHVFDLAKKASQVTVFCTTMDKFYIGYNKDLLGRRLEYYDRKKKTYDPIDYASISVASEWTVEGDGTPPPADLDIDSFEQTLAIDEGGETLVDIDFGLGLGRSTPADLDTYGLA